jgi:hypothetical protein
LRRREFIKAGAIALIVTAAAPAVAAGKSWQEMSPEELTREFVRLRRLGVTPNFECQHRCHRCGATYLCPDRYVMPDCGPSRVNQQIYGTPSVSMLCSPCSMNAERYGPAGFRGLWLEAHGVESAGRVFPTLPSPEWLRD